MIAVVRQTWQSWKNAKTLALLSILALAVGTGSTTAIYTVVDTVMLRPLPYQYGDRFVALYGMTFADPESYSSNTFTDLQTYQQRTQSFDVANREDVDHGGFGRMFEVHHPPKARAGAERTARR